MTLLDVPPGTLASVVTYLELRANELDADSVRGALPGELHLVRESQIELDRYRALFRRLGQRWLWFSRLRLDDDELGLILHDPAVDVFVLVRGERDVGLLELDRRQLPDVELGFIGLDEALQGQGLGRTLMAHAMRCAFERGDRLWVHTCTLDAPTALGFYRRFGFRATHRKIELTPDPRLDGTLPVDAAPDVPIL